MKRQIAMIALLFLGMGMTASAQFGKKFKCRESPASWKRRSIGSYLIRRGHRQHE